MTAITAQAVLADSSVDDTIGTITLGALMVIYLVGLPVTGIIAGFQWRHRSRVPSHVRETSVPPAAAGGGSASSDGGPAFLRLQSIERRTLALRDGPAAASAYRRLAAEAGELLARHGTGSRLGRHAAGLQAIAEALAPLDQTAPPAAAPPPSATVPDRPPDRCRVGLARFAAAGQPIPVDWAFSWYSHVDPTALESVAGHRHALVDAFARRYGETYPGGGMVVVVTEERLTLRYIPVSARFGGRPLDVVTELPEVVAQPDALRQLRAIGDAALRDLGVRRALFGESQRQQRCAECQPHRADRIADRQCGDRERAAPFAGPPDLAAGQVRHHDAERSERHRARKRPDRGDVDSCRSLWQLGWRGRVQLTHLPDIATSAGPAATAARPMSASTDLRAPITPRR